MRPIKAICPKALFSCKILDRDCVSSVSPGANMTIKGLKRAIFGVLTAIIVGFSGISPALAGAAIAPSPCDPQYYDSLRSRAWLEAQREITQNQNLIVKPDSVMEYTCFDRFLNILAFEAQNMFSETTRWGTILPNNSMDQALQSLVGAALSTHISSNFNHNFRGGRSTALNYTPAAISGAPGSSYTCTMMRDVWQESKCVDFAADPNTDSFYTFEHYRDNADKRTRPTPCNNAGLPARWTNEFNMATVNANTPWQEDNVVTYFNLLDPSTCGGSTLEIETGVVVRRSKQAPTEYEEKVCVPAGCHYVPTGMSTGNCQP
jgi:hypothetical protein